jgi:hydrogenase maturation protein HypF
MAGLVNEPGGQIKVLPGVFAMEELVGARLKITGIVQGVGFRPFIFTLAKRYDLSGWVRNTSEGVDIEVDGAYGRIQGFIQALHNEAPPLSKIDTFEVEQGPANGFHGFEIKKSFAIQGAFQPISPDTSICPDCLRELFDPRDRRYRYPFINCTNCGPRFTIIEDIPYDRPNTTMAGFPMCDACLEEYSEPTNRRFHAQPVACPDCGPHVWLEIPSSSGNGRQEKLQGDAAILETQAILATGKIVAIKGLGGFHLACDATNPSAVSELRRRKLRVDKPFALMMPDLETVQQHCLLSPSEMELLASHERPIVLLEMRPDSAISRLVAPYQHQLGVMLPYTPLHYLLFATASQGGHSSAAVSRVLVMTSGNLSEEPICTDNEEARQRLASLADAFLMHNRPIRTRCDDSVMRVFRAPAQTVPKSALVPIRRSRGYTPFPVRLSWDMPQVLAVGAELKNTFCLTRDRYAFLSHHIGDLENYETLQSFEDGIHHFERLFHVQPQLLAYDDHPNYLATRYALARAEAEGLPAVGVQHHHAHIAACMAENAIDSNQAVIGVAFDGTGYGKDSAIWGGEFLLTTYQGFQRAAHLAYMPLPGGDAAVRKPARTCLAYLWKAGLEWEPELSSVTSLCVEERVALKNQLIHAINTPLTSSMGRLFDAVSAFIGVRQKVNYEAQAAVELEALVDPHEEQAYSLGYKPAQSADSAPLIVDPAPMFEAIRADLHDGVAQSIISARFHNGIAQMVLNVCLTIRSQSSIHQVVLSGGVWQNMTLLEKTFRLLHNAGFDILTHQKVPANDGGLSLGQAVVAIHRLSYQNINGR